MRVAGALAMLACAACAGGPALRPVPPDGGGWRELRSARFVLRTDLSAGRARGLLAELEAVADALHEGLFEDRPKAPSLAIDVVAFESERDLELFLPPDLNAIVSADPGWSRLTIVMKGSFGELQRAVVAHELTHAFMASTLARQPLWFREGVASYAETIAWEGSAVARGRVPRWRQWSASRPRAAALRELLLAEGRLDGPQYSLAWGLVHYLMHRRAEPFGTLQERFAAGEDPLEAWRATFPEWDPDADGGAQRLLDEVWSYLKDDLPYDLVRGREPVGMPSFAERRLSAGEVHDVRLGLQWPNRGRAVPPEAFAAELEAALASGSVVAAFIRAQRAPAERMALAERATREHPADPRAWLLLAAATTEREGTERALRRAVEVDPSSAAARIGLAAYLLRTGSASGAPDHAREAHQHATEAVRLAPWSARSLEALAAVEQARGRCAEALRLQRRAVESVAESERAGPLLARYRERLAGLERSCGAAGAGAAR